MTTPATPSPAPAAPTDVANVDPTVVTADGVLAERAQNAGEYLAGLLAAGTLDAAGTPTKLPHLLFPDVDPWIVNAIWEAALPIGFRAGKLAAQPRWTPEALDRLRIQLHDAGYQAMAGLTARSRNIHPPRHPADDDTTATRAAHLHEEDHQ
ncbi:hypothetical protein AB0D56_30640 [Streptomyces sp. NPDC048209]|uniref:hypothetical protein n=1 Tax=Streptomyces sp. NPDC048209 TaxID=3156689 RepID=UPI0034247966